MDPYVRLKIMTTPDSRQITIELACESAISNGELWRTMQFLSDLVDTQNWHKPVSDAAVQQAHSEFREMRKRSLQ